MAVPLASNELWKVVEPLLPKQVSSPKGGRPPIDDRKTLTGIIFVLKSGIPWGDASAGNGLWLWHDVLASSSRLAGGRRLGTVAPSVIESIASGRSDRLVASHRG